MSFSLEEHELEDIADRITEKSGKIPVIRAIREMKAPVFREISPLLYQKEKMEHYTGRGEKEIIILNEPDVSEGSSQGKYWVADVFAQYDKPEKYRGFSGKDLWWQFPRRNKIVKRIFKTRNPSRISSIGFPSILMRKGEPKLEFELPDESLIFKSLILDRNHYSNSDEPRSKLVHTMYSGMTPSDKGKYLHAFIEVFSGLVQAYHYLSSRYWRNIFGCTSVEKEKKKAKRIEDVKNSITKMIRKSDNDFLSSDDGIEWLSGQVFSMAGSLPTSESSEPYEYFQEEARNDYDAFISALSPEQKRHWKEEDNFENLKVLLRELISLNIFLPGVRPQCPYCGSAYWYHIDEARQNMKCRGCLHEFSINPEEKWYYKINSLVEASCSRHGLMPVVLALGHLFLESQSSFTFAPSQNLFAANSINRKTELDICCIRDGKFIIGEVKQQKRFKPDDFAKMGEIATRIRPDVVIFASLDRTQKTRDNVIKGVEGLQKSLGPLGIEVMWLDLPEEIFEPMPI